MPSAEEIDVELCAAPNVSYSLSDLFVKPDKPPPFLKVLILSFSSCEYFVWISLMTPHPKSVCHLEY